MININNYIQEKLYISKDYKVDLNPVNDVLDHTLLSKYFKDRPDLKEGYIGGITGFIKVWVKSNYTNSIKYYAHAGDIQLMKKNKVDPDIINDIILVDSKELEKLWPPYTDPEWDNADIYIGTVRGAGKLKVRYKSIVILVIAE